MLVWGEVMPNPFVTSNNFNQFMELIGCPVRAVYGEQVNDTAWRISEWLGRSRNVIEKVREERDQYKGQRDQYKAQLEQMGRAGDVLAHELMHKYHAAKLDAWWAARAGHAECTVCSDVVGGEGIEPPTTAM